MSLVEKFRESRGLPSMIDKVYLVGGVGSSTLVESAQLSHQVVRSRIYINFAVDIDDVVQRREDVRLMLWIPPLSCRAFVHLVALS